MPPRNSLLRKDVENRHSRVRIFDPTLLDSDYMSIPSQTNPHARPSSQYFHLFVYNPTAGLTNPRMVSYPLDDETERANILANLPNVLSSPTDFTNPNYHVLTSVMIVETSAVLMSTTLPGSAKPPMERFHWRTHFGPADCNHNGIGVVPEKHAFPTSPQHPLTKATCLRFAKLYALGKALEKVCEIFADAKSSHLSRATLTKTNTALSWLALESLRQMKQVVFVIDDLLSMKWLLEDTDDQSPSEVVDLFCEKGSKVNGKLERQKGIHIVVWLRSMVKTLEKEAGVGVLYWGVDEAHRILWERKRAGDGARARSPTPELPSLRNIKFRQTTPNLSPSNLSIAASTSLTPNPLAASIALTNSLAKLTPPPVFASDYNSVPSSPTTSQKSFATTTPQITTSSTPLPPSHEAHSAQVDYILKKYLPIPTEDRALATDSEIRNRQSQVPPPGQIKTQKLRRDAILREAPTFPTEPARKKRKFNIVEVYLDSNGNEIDRSQVSARWKGAKYRKAVEVLSPVQSVEAQTIVPLNESLSSFSTEEQGPRDHEQPTNEVPPVVPANEPLSEEGASQLQSQQSEMAQNCGYDTNDTLDDEEAVAAEAEDKTEKKNSRGWALLAKPARGRGGWRGKRGRGRGRGGGRGGNSTGSQRVQSRRGPAEDSGTSNAEGEMPVMATWKTPKSTPLKAASSVRPGS